MKETDYTNDTLMCHILTPTMVLDTDAIIEGWMAEWNETPDICTEQWTLVSLDMMPDGRLALLFENEVMQYSFEDGELQEYPYTRKYRLLMYDVATGEQVGQYRFNVSDGYAATVFWRDGSLYAIISGNGRRSYTALQMWPGSADEKQFRIGNDIISSCVNAAGDITVAYALDPDSEINDDTVVGRTFFADGDTAEILAAWTDGQQIIDLNQGADDTIWVLLEDGQSVLALGEEICGYRVSLDGCISTAITDDGRDLYLLRPYEDDYKTLWRLRLSDEEQAETLLCQVEIHGDTVAYFDSAAFWGGYAALYIDGAVMVVDLNADPDRCIALT